MHKIKLSLVLLIVVALLIPTMALAQQGPPIVPPNENAKYADQVFYNAVIHTVDESNPQATAIAIKDDEIMAVGDMKDVNSFIRPWTEMVDMNGATIIPGLIDAHLHFNSGGLSLVRLDMVGKSKQECLDMVAERADELEPGVWIEGRGWRHAEWDPPDWPTRWSLDEVAPDNPCYFSRIDGHSAWVNSLALEIAGIDTAEGVIEAGLTGDDLRLDDDGKPTGILYRGGQNYLTPFIPAPPKEVLEEAYLAANDYALSVGLTGAHCASRNNIESVELYKELYEEEKLQVRLNIMLGDGTFMEHYYEKGRGPEIGLYGDRLDINTIKMQIDGSLGSRTARFFEDYSDEPGTRGVFYISPDDIEEVTTKALPEGFAVRVHAIGDEGNHETINAFEKSLEATGVTDHRLGIEHVSLLDTEDMERMKDLGIYSNIQPGFANFGWTWLDSRVGDRAYKLYRFGDMEELGLKMSGSTDWPVQRIYPLHQLHMGITRWTPDGQPPERYYPEQRLSREHTLYMYTLGAAKAGGNDHLVGSLTSGKYADLVVLEEDIITCPDENIAHIEILGTMVGGNFEYLSEKAESYMDYHDFFQWKGFSGRPGR